MAQQKMISWFFKPHYYLEKKLSEAWHNRFYLFTIFMLLVWLLAIGQDFINTCFNRLAFFLSESLLFNGFWLVFIPLTYSLFCVYSRREIKLVHGSLYLNVIIVSLIISTLHLFLFSFLIFAISNLIFTHSFGFFWAIVETFSEDYYKVFLIYNLIIFLNLKRRLFENDQIGAVNPVYSSVLSIRDGKKIIPVSVSNIYYISSDHPYIAIHTATKKHLYSSTLKQMGNELDSNQFIRVHRSTIINIKKVSELKSRLNGDYDLVLDNGIVLRMSRNFSQAVKNKLL